MTPRECRILCASDNMEIYAMQIYTRKKEILNESEYWRRESANDEKVCINEHETKSMQKKCNYKILIGFQEQHPWQLTPKCHHKRERDEKKMHKYFSTFYFWFNFGAE